MGSNDLTDKGEQDGDAPEVNYGSSEKGGIQEDDSRGGLPPHTGKKEQDLVGDDGEGQSGTTQPG